MNECVISPGGHLAVNPVGEDFATVTALHEAVQRDVRQRHVQHYVRHVVKHAQEALTHTTQTNC